MKITLKSLKHSVQFSEETACYRAIVCVDGVATFDAENQGCGGADFYHALPTAKVTLAQVNDWLKANVAPLEYPGMNPLPMDLELFVAGLIENTQREKRLSRILKSKIAVIDAHNGEPALFTYKNAPTPANLASLRRYLSDKKPNAVIVNDGPADVRDRALALV